MVDICREEVQLLTLREPEREAAGRGLSLTRLPRIRRSTGPMAAGSWRANRAVPLRGRTRELTAVGRFVDGVRAGESRVLVVRGELGIGKTTLLNYLAGQASRCRVARRTI